MCTQIYNDAAAEMQADSGGRLLPMALLPWWDVGLSVTEAERCAAMGMRGVNINSDPHRHGMADLAGDYWTPLWEFCADNGLPVNFHIGASDASTSWFADSSWPSLAPESKLALGSTMLFLSNARVLVNLIVSRPAGAVSEAELRLGGERRSAGFRSSSRRWTIRSAEVRRRTATGACRWPRSTTSAARSSPASGSSTRTWFPPCGPWGWTTSCSRPTSRTPPASIPARWSAPRRSRPRSPPEERRKTLQRQRRAGLQRAAGVTLRPGPR